MGLSGSSSKPRRARLLAICALAVCWTHVSAANCPKAIAGPTMNWVGSVCEARVETDDFINPDVQACIKGLATQHHVKGDPYEDCPTNKRLKAELCAYWVKLGAEKNLEACVKSPNTVPREVSEGVGG